MTAEKPPPRRILFGALMGLLKQARDGTFNLPVQVYAYDRQGLVYSSTITEKRPNDKEYECERDPIFPCYVLWIDCQGNGLTAEIMASLVTGVRFTQVEGKWWRRQFSFRHPAEQEPD